MVAAVETMAYAKSGGVPWHGFGFPVNDNMTPPAMLKAAKLDWTVALREMFFKTAAGKMSKVEREFVLVRETDESVLSLVGSRWKPVQNAEAMDFFRKYVKAGHMKMETAGSLWGGRYVWALARLEKDFVVGKGDDVQTYLLIMVPHIFGKAMVFQFTVIRVVCWNTLNAALGASLKGKGEHVFRVPHSVQFTDQTKANAELALGLATKQVDEFRDAAQILSKKKITTPKADEYFADVLQFDMKAAKKAKEELKPPRMFGQFQHALTYAPGQELSTAKGTLWGALNAVTHVIDHEVGKTRDTALKAAWFGSHAALKRRALDLALVRAK